jgi:hypothetical protein
MKTIASSSSSLPISSLVKKEEEHTSSTIHSYPLNGKWNMYFHLPADKDNVWTLESYREIKFHIHTAEEVIGVVRGLQENVVKYGLLFWMRTGIAPFWEDSKNRGMGAFSYKVSNRVVCDVWRHLCYAAAGETLCVHSGDSKHVNGLSISPKKGFCCVKIWMDSLEFQNPEMFIEIPGLSRTGCLFKKHDS